MQAAKVKERASLIVTDVHTLGGFIAAAQQCAAGVQAKAPYQVQIWKEDVCLVIAEDIESFRVAKSEALKSLALPSIPASRVVDSDGHVLTAFWLQAPLQNGAPTEE
jgi:hypothetical protein